MEFDLNFFTLKSDGILFQESIIFQQILKNFEPIRITISNHKIYDHFRYIKMAFLIKNQLKRQKESKNNQVLLKNINKMYQVEAIVGKRINSEGNFEYHVKWHNYPSEENTWEPEKNLKFVKNLIEDYNNKNEIKEGLGVQEVKKENKFMVKDEIRAKNGDKETKKNKIKNDSQDEQNKDEIYFDDQESEKQKKSSDSQYNSNTQKQRKRPKQKNQLSISQPLQRQVAQKQKQLSKVRYESKHPENKVQKQKQLVPSGTRTPPLPPDYQKNKQRYIDPQYARQKQQKFLEMNKHKMIEKERNKFSGQRPQNQYQFRPLANKQKIPSAGQMISWPKPMNSVIQKPSSRMIPRPPPPSFAQPIYQQNYFSNQYQVYSHPPPPQFAPLKPKQRPKPIPPPPRVYTPQIQPSYSNYNYSNSRTENIYMPPKNHMSRQVIAYDVIRMEKQTDGFQYLVQTNQGQIWMNRNELVPKYSTILLEFYERHLTFD